MLPTWIVALLSLLAAVSFYQLSPIPIPIRIVLIVAFLGLTVSYTYFTVDPILACSTRGVIIRNLITLIDIGVISLRFSDYRSHTPYIDQNKRLAHQARRLLREAHARERYIVELEDRADTREAYIKTLEQRSLT